MPTAKPNLEKLLHGAQLPALPQSAIRLLELSQDLNNGPKEFAAPIEADPGLTGQVLRFVNSSYFGFAQEISSIKLAITLVGVRTIKNFALWNAVFSLMPNPQCGPFDLKNLWQDSLRRAIFARVISRVLRPADSEDLFAAALLQDMAVPLLAKELTDKYRDLLKARQEGETRLSDLEQEEFGWTHAHAAALMARGWRLSESFVKLLADHTQLDKLSAEDESQAGRFVVALSALLPCSCDSQWKERETFQAVYDQCLGNRLSLRKTLHEVDREFAEFAPVMRLGTAIKPLAGHFSDEANLELAPLPSPSFSRGA